MKSNRILVAIFTMMVIASLLVGCGGAAKEEAGGKVKVGLSFSDFATERWKNEEVLMRGLLEEKGYEVISAEANHDVKLQNDQIDNMVSQGVKGLLVVAEDGDAIVTSVDKAADAGVKVIAYDRLIKTSKIAAYLSFDNVEVGRQQALGVMTAMGLPGSTTWTKDNPIKLVQLAGSPTDNNATLFTKGQTEVLQPYVDSGVVKIVAQQGVENWDPANALKLMENILTAQSNKVDAVVASNDGTALGALQAMKAQGLAGVVPISGQDATADGCNSIVKGELTVSILKDIRNLSPLAIDVMDKLLKGEAVDGMKNFTLAELTVDDTKKGEVPCVFLEVQQVNKDNVYDLVVASEFQAYDDVYRDIPADQRPPKPGEAAAPAVAEEPAQKVTVTWWHISTAEEHKAVWQKMADDYMAAHPNVTIEITVLENEAFKTKLTTVMQSGEPPDIFQSWGGGVMNEYVEAGLLKDISADLDADGGAWRDTFAPGALGVYSYKDKNYGVPWDMGMIGFWYNKDLFAQAGIEAPPVTWTEFLADVKALKAAGITPIALGEGDKWPGMHMWAYLVTRLGGKANFDGALLRTGSFTDAPFVDAGYKLQELMALEPFQDGFLGATYGDEATAMGNGKAAMELMGQWAPAVQKDNSEDKMGIGDNLGWFPFPMVEGGAGDPGDAVGGGNGVAIGKNASPEAIDFVKYLTTAEAQQELVKINVAIPVVKGGEVGMSDPLMITLQESLANAQYFQLYYDQALPPAMGSVINDSVQGIFAGTLTPEQAAQAIEDSAAQELK